MPTGKINILWLWDRLDGIGGVETLLLSMAKNLDRSRFDIYIGVFKMGYVASYFEEAGVKVVEIPRKGKFDFQTIPMLMKIIRELEIDMIHTHGHFPGFVGRIAGKLIGKKVISTYHLALHEDGHPYFTKILTKMTLPLADYVTFVSRGVEESFYNESMVFDKGLIGKRTHFTIYNGVDLNGIDRVVSTVDKNTVRKELSVSRDEVLLLSVGRLTEQKGHRYLITAIAEVVKHCLNAKLLIFGEGELKSALKSLIKDYALADRIRIMPPTRDIFKVMVGSDIFVLPSLWEGLPMGLIEAMAIGKPVVASNVTGVNELITSGVNGILVESKNPEALFEAIVKVIKDKELSMSLSENARKTIEKNFTIEKMAESYIYLYEA